eukprot:6461922-Amphidinium_carterae.1
MEKYNKAKPRPAITNQAPIAAQLGGVPIVLVVVLAVCADAPSSTSQCQCCALSHACREAFKLVHNRSTNFWMMTTAWFRASEC